jgi:tripartite-type tricarboxylate transporter receptor subunit TctC
MRPIQFRGAACALAATYALALGVLASDPSAAQLSDYPNRKLTFMVGFAPGGGIDTMARLVGQGLTEQLGYQHVVENRPGAASNIAARAVASAAPDGYTMLVTGNSLAINQVLYKNPGYSIDELAPITFPARDSTALAINVDHPARTLSEFIAASKGKPFNYGYGGSSARIIGEYVFKVLLKAEATGVPFQSGAPAINALLGHHVDIVVGPIAEIFTQVQQGNMRAIVVTGIQRSRALADVQTLNEAGFPGVDISGWNGFFVPAKVSPEIAVKLNAAINAVVKNPNTEQRLRQLGYEPFTLPYPEAAPFLKTSLDAWARMVREAGISAE